MSDIRRRLKKAENKMNLNKEPIIITITEYGDELPPDHTDGNITIHYVRHDEKEGNEDREQAKWTEPNETERFEQEL